MTRRAKIILLLIIIVASALRLAGLFDDFWLDEIWSYEIAQRLKRPLDVLLAPAAHSDNNHPLNTLLIWFMGPQANWYVYRVPSLLAGIGSVLLASRILRLYGTTQTILGTALIGLSFPLIFFSSEARGYSLAVFFALLAFEAQDRSHRTPAWTTAALFWAACLLGLLSHLSFVHVYLGLLAQAVYRIARADARRVAAIDAARLHLLPLLGLCLMYAVFVRNMTVGGAPEQPLWQGICDAVTRLLFIPGPVELQIAVTAAAALLFAALIRSLVRQKSDLWILLIVAAIVSPALAIVRQALVLEHHQPMHARYFLVILPLVFLAASIVLAEAITKPGARRIITIVLAGFFALQLWQTARFIQVGRGHYADAVLYMSQRTPGAVVEVVSDHRLRTGLVLNFYSRLLPPGKRLAIIDGTQDSSAAAQLTAPWLIVHHNVTGAPPGRTIGPYDFDREFTYYGLSGYSWYLYRRSAR